MSFSAHRSDMALFVSKLRACQEKVHPFKDIVAESLEHMTKHTDAFDVNVSYSPFIEHFVSLITSSLDDDDDGIYFGLFEDIAIFFREKTLKTSGAGNAIEQRVLDFFESFGEWHPLDGTMVSDWYWKKLPRVAGLLPNKTL